MCVCVRVCVQACVCVWGGGGTWGSSTLQGGTPAPSARSAEASKIAIAQVVVSASGAILLTATAPAAADSCVDARVLLQPDEKGPSMPAHEVATRRAAASPRAVVNATRNVRAPAARGGFEVLGA